MYDPVCACVRTRRVFSYYKKEKKQKSALRRKKNLQCVKVIKQR